MSEKWLEEISSGIDSFFKSASDQDIIQSLRDADYFSYTGIAPELNFIQSSVWTSEPVVFSKAFLFKDKSETEVLVSNFEQITLAADSDVRYRLAA